jgi:hypothetical protein
MSHTKTRLAFIAIIATSAATSHQVQAQSAFAALDVSVRPAAAEEMEQRAHDLVLTGHGWEQAAGLYRRAAELRGTDDVKSADNMRLAGYIHYYRGRSQASVLALTHAGEAFLALGDVEGAAEALIDGAWVATQAGMSTPALALAERARRLTRSPLLQPEERSALARRLGTPPSSE